MKKTFYGLFTYLSVTVFSFYWTGVFICSLPSSQATNFITSKTPRFKTIFAFPWRLFSPPYTFNHRLYFVIRDPKAPQKTDQVEVLENLSLQKQQNAPFNQKERAIDYLVQKNVTNMLRAVWEYKQIPSETVPGTTDSSYIATAIAAKKDSKIYRDCLGTFNNYCIMWLKDKKVDITGKELKLIITQKSIQPYKERDSNQFTNKEIVVFETNYQPLPNDVATN